MLERIGSPMLENHDRREWILLYGKQRILKI